MGTNIQTISSVRGSSSHHNNPFLILCQQDATETSGSCYGVMMVYSGSYQMDVERSQTGLGPGSERHSGGTFCVEPEAGRDL